MSVEDDLKWALSEFSSDRIERCSLYGNYYEGNQRLRFATEKFKNVFGMLFREFAENACGTVVDSIADRLKVTGFDTSQSQTTKENVPTDIQGVKFNRTKVNTIDPLGDELLKIWERNRMHKKSTMCHKEALKLGDGFVIVWPDLKDPKFPRIWIQNGWQCAVRYGNEDGEQEDISVGAKIWFESTEPRWYLNLYYPDAIVKYASSDKRKERPDGHAKWEPSGGVVNPYGRVPIFHFSNARHCTYGSSELRDVVPLQDGLNKACMDLLVTMEFAAFKQRWVTGIDIEVDEVTGEVEDPAIKNYGVDRLMGFSDPETKVGQFDATDLDQFLRVQEKFWASISRVTGIPLHYFFITHGDFPSGEAMKTAEAKFVGKLTDRQDDYGDDWAEVMRFCAKVAGVNVADEDQITTTWVDAAQKSEAERWDTAVKKKNVGVSRSQILRENGYDEDTILKMLEENDNDSIQSVALQAQTSQQGPPPGGKGTPGSGVNRNGQPTPRPGKGKGVRR